MQRQVPTIQRVQKNVEVPTKVQYIATVVDVPVVMERGSGHRGCAGNCGGATVSVHRQGRGRSCDHVATSSSSPKSSADSGGASNSVHRQSGCQIVRKTVEIPQVRFLDKVVDMPVVSSFHDAYSNVW